MDKTSNRYWVFCIYLALVFSSLAVFYQVGNYDFVNLDDYGYVGDNARVKAGLTRESISWAFTTGYHSNWHPLTWLSHMLDCQLFGNNVGRYHLVNFLLHLLNSLLLFAVFRAMTGALWPSAFVAAAFALHPLHVESVAWISERKDVLSTLFWLLTMAAYLHYVKRPAIGRYLLALVVFALGLMAKPMLVTLPFVLLLLDYWPLGRFEPGEAGRQADESRSTGSRWSIILQLVREKAAFFVLSAVSSVVTFVVQRSGGSMVPIKVYSLRLQVVNALVSYLTYIEKMIWPSRLSVFYPISAMSIWRVVAAVVLLAAISKYVIRLGRSHRYLAVGWLWYLGTLVPVIGLVQVGHQAMADRYTYVPLIGLFIIISWGVPELLTKWKYRKIILAVSAVIVLLGLSICTYLQQRYWQNSFTLFEHALDVTENNHIAHYCLGGALQREGKVGEAIVHYKEALRINPNYIEAHNNLGPLLAQLGQHDEAIEHFNEALRINPNYAEAHNNLGTLLFRLGQRNEAIKHFNEALRIQPDYPRARRNLKIVLAQNGVRK